MNHSNYCFLPCKSPGLVSLVIGLLWGGCTPGFTQSLPLPSDRTRIQVAQITDPTDPSKTLKVLRTDQNSPLRGASPWILNKSTPPNSPEIGYAFFKDQADQHLNSVRIVWFQAWFECDARQRGQSPNPNDITDFNDPAQVQHCLQVLEAAVNNASANGLYACINFHSAWKGPQSPSYSAAFWNVVAPYFANRTHVIYEVSNEPVAGSGGFTVAGDRGTDLSTQVSLYNICKNAAPNTMRIMFSPPSIEDMPGNTPFIQGIQRFESQIPGGVDWSTTAAGYHTYYMGWNTSCNCARTTSEPIRVLHRSYPGFPTEINFPTGVLAAPYNNCPSLDGETYQTQTLERLGTGWWLWAVSHPDSSPEGWYSNWNFVKNDAVTKNYFWAKDPIATDTLAPTPPTALAATNVTASTATLTWGPSTDNVGLTNYEVFKNGLSLGTAPTTTFSATGLGCATTLAFTVKARDYAGNLSLASNALTVTTAACPTSFTIEAETAFSVVTDVGSSCTIAPSDYGATTASNGLVVLLCDAGDEIKLPLTIPVTGAYDLSIRLRSGWNGNPTYYLTNNKYEYRVNDLLRTFGLVPGSVSSTIDVDSYYATVKLSGINLSAGLNFVRIKALEYWAKVDFVRAELIATPDSQSPTVPTGLVAASITGSGFQLSWSASTDNVGATGYEVFRNGVSLGTTPGLSFTVTGLSCGASAAMTVKARDAAANWSLTSIPLNVTTLPPPNAGTVSGSEALCLGSTSPYASSGAAGGSWASSNLAVATVNASGVVTGIAAGTVTISYSLTANGCSATASKVLTVNALPNVGTVSGLNSISAGTTTTYTSNGTAGGSWASSNLAVATVNASGVVTGVAAGTVTISYSLTANGCSTSAIKALIVNAASTTLITVRAKSVGAGGSNLTIEVMDSSAPTGGVVQQTRTFTNLPTSFANYTFVATGVVAANRIRVRYPNDAGNRDVELDYVEVGGTTYQTEASSTYQIGVWTNSTNGCSLGGYYTSSVLHCTGYVHFLAAPTITAIVVRAKSVGAAGSNLTIEVMDSSAPTGGVVQQTRTFTNLPTGFADYAFVSSGAIPANRIRVRYPNDDAGRDLEIDYVQVGGTTHQAEASSTYQIGVWTNPTDGCSLGGYYGSSVLHCTGYVHFLANSSVLRLSAPASPETSRDEGSASAGMRLYPNPTKGIVSIALNTLKAQLVEFTIYDLMGTAVFQSEVSLAQGSNELSLPLSLRPGVYVVRTTLDGKSNRQKLVIAN